MPSTDHHPPPDHPAPLAIACGDHAGVGAEVTLRALAVNADLLEHSRFVLIGDAAHLRRLDARLATRLPLDTPRLTLLDPRARPLPEHLVPGSAETALAALDYLAHAAEGCRDGRYAALVTAPVSKEAILRAGVPFVGQTEFLAGRGRENEVTMMLLGDDDRGRWLRVALVTTHLPLREVVPSLTHEAVLRTLRHAAGACRRLELPRARIGLCGVNPHAGEGGLLGTEEIEILAPALRAARNEGLDVHGPFSADTLFHQALRGDYDVVVAVYHDQGLAPLKLVAFERGINWTLGLPYVRTSPDHGTAFDIAARHVADPSSMTAALRLALRLRRFPG